MARYCCPIAALKKSALSNFCIGSQWSGPMRPMDGAGAKDGLGLQEWARCGRRKYAVSELVAAAVFFGAP